MPGRLQRDDVADAGVEALRVVAAGAAVDCRMRAHVGPSLTAAALAALPVGRLAGKDYQALTRLHTHAVEPEVLAWGGAGCACRMCGRAAFAGHHRVCGARMGGALTRAHTRVQQTLCAYIAEMPGWHAETEHDAGEMGDGTTARGDIFVRDPKGNEYYVEVKTWDPRCQTWRGKTATAAEKALFKKAEGQYPDGVPVRPFVVGVDGTLGSGARHLVNEMQVAREAVGTHDERDDVPSRARRWHAHWRAWRL